MTWLRYQCNALPAIELSSQPGASQIVSSHNHYVTSSVPISASFIPTSADGMYGAMMPSGQENAIKLPDYTVNKIKTILGFKYTRN